MTTETRTKGIAAGVTALFFLALVASIYLYKENGSLSGFLDDAKLKSEKLLSEKLLLDKNVEALKKDLTNLKGVNSDLDKKISAMLKTISEREARIAQLNRDKASYSAIRKEYNELQKVREDLANQLEGLLRKNNQLTLENSDLNRKITDMQDQNTTMLAELNKLRNLADGPEAFMVEVQKKKVDKLTVKASKAKRINVSFEIPEALKGLPSTYTIDIVSEGGKKLNGVANITSNSIRSGAVASINSGPSVVGTQRVNIEFAPSEKLNKGIYTFNIYKNGDLVARTKAHLSK